MHRCVWTYEQVCTHLCSHTWPVTHTCVSPSTRTCGHMFTWLCVCTGRLWVSVNRCEHRCEHRCAEVCAGAAHMHAQVSLCRCVRAATPVLFCAHTCGGYLCVLTGVVLLSHLPRCVCSHRCGSQLHFHKCLCAHRCGVVTPAQVLMLTQVCCCCHTCPGVRCPTCHTRVCRGRGGCVCTGRHLGLQLDPGVHEHLWVHSPRCAQLRCAQGLGTHKPQVCSGTDVHKDPGVHKA